MEKTILIFDRKGDLGILLVKQLVTDYLCVLVSGKLRDKRENVIHVSLTKKIPVIPKCLYSAFFVVYSGERNILNLLPEFIKKAKEDNAHIYFIATIREVNEELLNDVLLLSSKISILLLGDVFGLKPEWKNPLTEILSLAGSGKITLDNNGLSSLYPIEVNDAVAVICRAVNHKGIPGHRTIYLLPPHPVTELSFARILHNKEPLLNINIYGSAVKQNLNYEPRNYTSVFGQSYAFTKKLPIVEITPIKQAIKNPQKHKLKIPTFKRRWLYVPGFVLIVSIFGLPILSSMLGAGFLYRFSGYTARGDFQKAKEQATAAKRFFTLADNTSSSLKIFKFLGLGKATDEVIANIQSGVSLSKVSVLGVNGAMSLKKVFSGESMDPKDDFINGIRNVKDALVQVSELQADGQTPQNLKAQLKQFNQISRFSTAVLDVLPDIVGMNGRRSYLMLFQNNMELRPGGGFIGSYASLDIKNGKITDLLIHNVYDADGQLKDHYEPPFQLRRYMGASHWFLRDSNFDIDFPNDAAFAASFYRAEVGKEVDGIIALDTTFVKSLLGVVGPLKIPGYKDAISADNFFLLTEKNAQDNFFAGSSQKQDFLKAVYGSLFSKLTETKSIRFLDIITAMADSVVQKHLLFAFSDKNIQQAFAISGMSSALVDNASIADGQFKDFIGINEANVGANKTNYYLDRSLIHKAILNIDGSLSETITVRYKNKSTVLDKYGGDYKNYFRLVLPSGAQLQSIAFDGIIQSITPAITDPAVFNAIGFTPPSGLEVDQSKQSGKTVYGFLLTVPMSTEKTVTINYSLDTTLTPENPSMQYSLYVYKQPGTEADPYIFNFQYPDSFKVIQSSTDLKSGTNSLSLLTALSEDRSIEISLAKK
jgi:hypothetical protein